MAFWFLDSSEVWNNLFRSHNNFSEKKYARAYNLADHTHDTYNGVNLWKIAAVGSKLFPDIWYSIQTNDIHTLVGKIQHIVDTITGRSDEEREALKELGACIDTLMIACQHLDEERRAALIRVALDMLAAQHAEREGEQD